MSVRVLVATALLLGTTSYFVGRSWFEPTHKAPAMIDGELGATAPPETSKGPSRSRPARTSSPGVAVAPSRSPPPIELPRLGTLDRRILEGKRALGMFRSSARAAFLVRAR